MEKYIGISDNRLKHIIGVARRCYEYAKEEGMSEEEARYLFMLGYLHDVGYEFSSEQQMHPIVGYELTNNLGIDLKEIKLHGDSDAQMTKYLKILNYADLTVDSKGNYVTVEERLKDIKDRYGDNCDAYIKPYELALKLKFIKEKTK